MSKAAILISCVSAALLAGATGSSLAQQELPPGHPPTTPQLPPGHPPMKPASTAPADETPTADPADPADPADVQTIDSIISAYYASISGAAGQARPWDRFRSLFASDARFITIRPAAGGAQPITLTPDRYVKMNRRYFESGGYFETEIHRSVDRFGAIAQVFSTYASRRSLADPDPYSRGINSIQLIHDGQRWWIATVAWDFERPDDQPIPPAYLP